jgi:3'-phosphoadenosine 5'-phosphosulfate sulfotransferase (PAPS reductase)/FAD synthetase
MRGKPVSLTHLQRLESESIHIMREAVAEARKPVMLYSMGKDSSVMVHLARKAFAPRPPPFSLLHVDTTWKFRAMYEFRDRAAREYGMDLIVHQNPEAKARQINPFEHGSRLHTELWKTEVLKQALDLHGFDVAFGGARRDEEASRAKERVFSFRGANHQWDPKSQRPELWRLYNAMKPGRCSFCEPTQRNCWSECFARHRWGSIDCDSFQCRPSRAEKPLGVRRFCRLLPPQARLLFQLQRPPLRSQRPRSCLLQ